MYASAYVWAKIIGYLEERLTSVVISTTFDDTEVVEFTEEALTLYTPTDYHRDVILTRFAPYIQEALKEQFDSTARLVVLNTKMLEERQQKAKNPEPSGINRNFSFDNFVVGPSNRFAYNGAIAVSNHPGIVYNPLFIYGPPGLGKTHLLHAIANNIHKANPDAKIVNIKGEQFTNELLEAIRTGNNFAFRTKYREADLFLIDDVQFIAGKESTQEEFFHTFNALYESGKQIVITADRKPSDMLTLETRLQSRFESGLMADIQPPDYETRMAIIKSKAISLGLELPADVCDYIASNITSNVRQLEGTVKKLLAYKNLNMPMDLPNVSRAISDMFKQAGNALPTSSLIISQVCKFFSIEEHVVRSTLKNKGTNEARQVAMYLIRKLTNLSFPEIGKEFGRDHTTVIHACSKIEAELKMQNETMKNNIRDITANINSSL